MVETQTQTALKNLVNDLQVKKELPQDNVLKFLLESIITNLNTSCNKTENEVALNLKQLMETYISTIRVKQATFQKNCNEELENILNTESIMDLLKEDIKGISEGDKDISKRKFTEIATLDNDKDIDNNLLKSKKLAKYYSLKVKKMENLLEVKSNNKYLIYMNLLKVIKVIIHDQEVELKDNSLIRQSSQDLDCDDL
jgi:hypothetical protein